MNFGSLDIQFFTSEAEFDKGAAFYILTKRLVDNHVAAAKQGGGQKEFDDYLKNIFWPAEVEKAKSAGTSSMQSIEKGQ